MAATASHSFCELCNRAIGYATEGGGPGLCASCQDRLASPRGSQCMAIGRRVAAVLSLSGPLSAELVAFRLGEAACEGRLESALAEAAGVETGAHLCPVCGMRHGSEQGAMGCCASVPRPAGKAPRQPENSPEPASEIAAAGDRSRAISIRKRGVPHVVLEG